jgi:hypothetical protein
MRTMNKLQITPNRPMQVTMMENPKAFLTPAMVKKYVV